MDKLNKGACKRAFGDVPEGFERRVLTTLHEIEEEKPMRKNGLRFALVMIVLVILLAGVALAAMAPRGLQDLLSERSPYGWEGAEGTAVPDAPLAEMEALGVTMAVMDAAFDGETVYASARITPPQGDAGLMPYHDLGWVLHRDRPWTDEAKPEAGKKAVMTQMNAFGHKLAPVMAIENEDGTLDVLFAAMIGINGEIEGPVDVLCVLRVQDANGTKRTDSTRMDVAAMDQAEFVRLTLKERVVVPDSPVVVTDGRMVRTPYGVQVTIDYTVAEDDEALAKWMLEVAGMLHKTKDGDLYYDGWLHGSALYPLTEEGEPYLAGAVLGYMKIDLPGRKGSRISFSLVNEGQPDALDIVPVLMYKDQAFEREKVRLEFVPEA